MKYRKPAFVVNAFALLAALALATPLAKSQTEANYPSKTIRLVVPLAAGGPSDAAARAVARALAPKLGAEIIVENKPGANGALGASAVLAAPADGYTLLFAPLSIAGLPATMKDARGHHVQGLSGDGRS